MKLIVGKPTDQLNVTAFFQNLEEPSAHSQPLVQQVASVADPDADLGGCEDAADGQSVMEADDEEEEEEVDPGDWAELNLDVMKFCQALNSNHVQVQRYRCDVFADKCVQFDHTTPDARLLITLPAIAVTVD